jgi:hypothetical protein
VGQCEFPLLQFKMTLALLTATGIDDPQEIFVFSYKIGSNADTAAVRLTSADGCFGYITFENGILRWLRPPTPTFGRRGQSVRGIHQTNVADKYLVIVGIWHPFSFSVSKLVDPRSLVIR